MGAVGQTDSGLVGEKKVHAWDELDHLQLWDALVAAVAVHPSTLDKATSATRLPWGPTNATVHPSGE